MNKNYSYVLASNRFDALIELNNELNNSFPNGKTEIYINTSEWNDTRRFYHTSV